MGRHSERLSKSNKGIGEVRWSSEDMLNGMCLHALCIPSAERLAVLKKEVNFAYK